MNKILTIISFLVILIGTNSFSQEKILNDSIYNRMFWIASGKVQKEDTTFQIISTSPFYVVITVTDLKTNQTKEICTEYPFLEGAIDRDNGNAIIDLEKRIFKFRSDSALQNVGFFDYDTTKYNACINGITVEQLIKEWQDDYLKFWNKYSGDCQEYYAFLLFKNGIMTKRGCLIGSFSIVSEEKIIREKKVK